MISSVGISWLHSSPFSPHLCGKERRQALIAASSSVSILSGSPPPPPPRKNGNRNADLAFLAYLILTGRFRNVSEFLRQCLQPALTVTLVKAGPVEVPAAGPAAVDHV